jgi:D-glycero-D-manno-heptose 1,7-bisphosphate phosphatase
VGIGGGQVIPVTKMCRAVFLDRDGVVNAAVVRGGKPYPPANARELKILPGVAEALAALKEAEFLLIVVSNQPDVARGTTSRATVEEINAALGVALPIDEFVMCYHDNADGCACRKPKPGMLLDAAARRAIDLSASCMVGDRWRDIEAGEKAGCKTVFIDYGYDEKQPVRADHKTRSLLEAVPYILSL